MGTDNPPSPYDAAIADVEARIRSMQMALETLKQLRASALGEPISPTTNVSRSGDSEVQHDSFFGMTIADAARKFLTMKKATNPTGDIASALEQGGLKHSSKDFNTTVRSVLGQQREIFLRVPNGDWGLVEWYPGQGRGKKSKPETKAKRKVKRSRKAGKAPTLEQRILDLMKTKPDADWVSSDIAVTLEANRDSIQSTLSRLAKDGKRVTKAERGYRLVRTAG
jgi:hypothetical protein